MFAKIVWIIICKTTLGSVLHAFREVEQWITDGVHFLNSGYITVSY